MDEFAFIIDNAQRITVIALLLGGAFAVHKKWLVPGWVYDQCNQRLVTLDQILSANAARVESKLERLEEESRQRYTRERP